MNFLQILCNKIILRSNAFRVPTWVALPVPLPLLRCSSPSYPRSGTRNGNGYRIDNAVTWGNVKHLWTAVTQKLSAPLKSGLDRWNVNGIWLSTFFENLVMQDSKSWTFQKYYPENRGS